VTDVVVDDAVQFLRRSTKPTSSTVRGSSWTGPCCWSARCPGCRCRGWRGSRTAARWCSAGEFDVSTPVEGSRSCERASTTPPRTRASQPTTPVNCDATTTYTY